MRIWLSPYFSREDFACRCGCGADTVDAELLAVLNEVQHYYGRTLIIQEAMRCPTYNLSLPDADPKSQHLLGKAADFRVETIPNREVIEFLEKYFPGRFGIGRYPEHIHLDVRNQPARWNKLETHEG